MTPDAIALKIKKMVFLALKLSRRALSLIRLSLIAAAHQLKSPTVRIKAAAMRLIPQKITFVNSVEY